MGRLWLALALLAVLAGTALADRVPVCTCRTAITLPRQGATGVPTNARFWRIPASGDTPTPDQRIQVYELAPHTTYELTNQHLSFTTGDGPDDTPPVEPTIGAVSITLDSAHHVSLLRIAGTFSSDTAVVRVSLGTAAGTFVYYTTPDQLSICAPGFDLPAAKVSVWIAAFDLAGNASSAATLTTTAIISPDAAPSCSESPRMRGPCVPIFLLEEWVIGPIIFVAGLAILYLLRGRRRSGATPEPIALPAIEALARAIRRRAILCFTAIGVATTIAWDTEILMLGAPVLVIVAFKTAAGWDAAGRVLKLASYDGATATVCSDEVRVTVGGQEATLRAAPWRVQRARAHGVPQARI